MAEGLVFTSPWDDAIDRAAYFDRCFPTADRLVHEEILAWSWLTTGKTATSCTSRS
jgi:hypothetical protein